MDREQFCGVMRQHAGGIALVCTGVIGHRLGLTATSVCSVTDTPPTILVCVNKSASAHHTIADTNKFSINLLGDQHKDIACIFAGQSDLNGEERFKFGGGTWISHASGTPWLEDAIAHMDCTVLEKKEFSSHTVFIAQVNEGGTNEDLSPLLYFRGKFGRLSQI